MYLCLSCCSFKSLLLFCFSMESRHFLAFISPCGTLQNFLFDFWFRPPNAQNLLPKIYIFTKSLTTRLVWQIDRICLHQPGGFRWRPIQWNHAQCCGADPCCHGNEIWANLGYFSTKSPISRVVRQIDRICVGLLGETTRGRSLLPWQRHLR